MDDSRGVPERSPRTVEIARKLIDEVNLSNGEDVLTLQLALVVMGYEEPPSTHDRRRVASKLLEERLNDNSHALTCEIIIATFPADDPLLQQAQQQLDQLAQQMAEKREKNRGKRTRRSRNTPRAAAE